MNRKEIVQKLRDTLGVTPKYLGTPSFSYQIETEEETYTIDREGIIKNSAGEEVPIETILNSSNPDPETERTATESMALLVDGFEVKLPLEGYTGIILRNIVNMLSSKQKLIMKAFDLSEPLIDEDFAEGLSKKEIVSLEDFKTSFTEVGSDKCPGLILNFEESTFSFRLLAPHLEPDKMIAFQDLAVKICENAKELKHASFKAAQEDNPKFALRTWLTRLGMNGNTYKTTRKVLLANLEGNSAFRRVGEENHG